MRVLLVSGSYPPMPCGVGDYTAQLANALGRRGDATAAVLTGIAAEGATGEGVELFPVVRTWGIAEAPSIVGRIRRWRPDVVHIQYPTRYYRRIQWVLPLLARIYNGAVVQTWHEYYSSRSWPSILNAALPGGLVVVRPNYREKMPGWYRWLIRRKEFRFIPNASSIPAVRLTEDERAAVRSRVGANGEGLIAYFGFASPAKGIESLFEIADPQRHRIVLICDLSAADAYQATILALANRADWAGKVVVTGFLPPEEAGRLLAAADAAVFPFKDGGGEWNSSIHSASVQGTFVLTTSLERRGYDDGKNIHYATAGDLEGMRQVLRGPMEKRIPAEIESPMAGWNTIADSHMELYRALLGRTGEAGSLPQDAEGEK
jgi:glycosyltransferase involved in cell wall biosynthesis